MRFSHVAAAILLCCLCSGRQNSPSAIGSNNPPEAAKPGAANSEPTPVFHVDTRLVIVDVVAIAHDGQPVRGLQRDSFQLLEDGKPQQLQVFEEHLPAVQPARLPEIKLPADEYTNFPKQVNSSAVNIVLFDILNTPMSDQLYARAQMIDFLKTLPRGQRTALFTLGSDLHMMAGFTTSTDELLAAANHVVPNASAYLDTDADRAAVDRQIQMATQGLSPSQSGTDRGGPRSFGQMMQEFATEVEQVRVDDRAQRTFEGLGQLARAVSGYPGRKNLLWLSEAFPSGILPSRGDSTHFTRSYLGLMQKYSGFLAASQISVYPIDIRGLSASSSRSMTASQATMDEIAHQTGGEAFYNTNDLKGALKRGIEHGSTYYTLAYIPENKNWNGKLRRIDVKVNRSGLTLNYRRGYYATRDDPTLVEAAHRTFVAEMQAGVPESTMLLLRARVLPPDDKNPMVRVDCAVFAPDISFSGDDRLHHAKLEWVAIAWDRNSHAAANTSETMELDLQPETYATIQKTGISAHQELNLPPGTYRLRLGVMDYSTSKIGTLEIPLRVGNTAIATK
ncbi:MAG: VWA domain-containing protein [Acidobacteriia bacterium]|nr:VWA domain-containing protein [Terriglobia bacterium]